MVTHLNEVDQKKKKLLEEEYNMVNRKNELLDSIFKSQESKLEEYRKLESQWRDMKSEEMQENYAQLARQSMFLDTGLTIAKSQREEADKAIAGHRYVSGFVVSEHAFTLMAELFNQIFELLENNQISIRTADEIIGRVKGENEEEKH